MTSSVSKAYTLTPGQMQIAIEAKLKGADKKLRCEEIVLLKAGEITTIPLSLA